MKQWDFVVNWGILVFSRFRVSDQLLLEVIEPENVPIEVYAFNYRPKFITLAYVGVPDENGSHRTADSILHLFLLICALISDIPFTYRGGAGRPLSSLAALGKERAIYQSLYQTVKVHSSNPESTQRVVILAKNRFLELHDNREQILDSYLGVALRYYAYAMRANIRGPQRRIDELIIHLAIAAEALLTDSGESISKTMQQVISKLNVKTLDDTIMQTMKWFYNLRCAIVHGRKTIITDDELNLTLKAKTYIQTAINTALELRFYHKKDLINYLNTQIHD
jgi:hypothetical protein